MNRTYSGIIVPTPTPVLPDETVDEESYRAHIEFQIRNGVNGIFSCGSLGESMALTESERTRAIRIAADQAKGRVKVFAGVMDTSTKRVIENTKRIEDCGADAVVLTPVFYDRHTSQSEIIRLFEDVAKTTKLDIVAYNIPSFVVEKINPETALELAKMDQVKAYKDSGANFNETLKILDTLGEDRGDFAFLQGTPVQWIPTAFVGADGCVPSMASVYPRMFAAAYQATVDKDYEAMKKFHHMVLMVGKVYGAAKNGTASLKYAAWKKGFFRYPNIIRPQDGVNEAEAAKIDLLLAQCDEYLKQEGLLDV